MKVKEKIPALINMYRNYKVEMAVKGKNIGLNDFKKELLLTSGGSLEEKKKDFCLKHIFTIC